MSIEATVIAVLTDAGDLLQASNPSFPAEVTTTTPILIAAATAVLMELLFEPPSDISENQTESFKIVHMRKKREIQKQHRNLLVTIGVLGFADFSCAT